MSLIGAVPALVTGILYDEKSLDLAIEFAARFDYDAVEAERPRLVAEGLSGKLGDETTESLATRIIEIAESGLSRRARVGPGGADERQYLAPLRELVARGECPADRLVFGLSPGSAVSTKELITRCRM
jgi:glutamate--cysteine ligase